MAQDSFAAIPRIWLGSEGPGPQTRFFRRSFVLSTSPAEASLRVYAEANYHLWVNGQYVGRGPIFHHPTCRPYDNFELAKHLQAGQNVLAILVHAPGVALHNAVPSGEPGLMAELHCRLTGGNTLQLESDEQWRATEQTGWLPAPKRSWAIGFVEQFDVAAAPRDWQQCDFDDSGWSSPVAHRPASAITGVEYVARPVPDLRYAFIAPGVVMGIHGITAAPAAIDAPGTNLGRNLMEATWTPPQDGLALQGHLPAELTVVGLRPDQGAILCLDMGAEYVGQVLLECQCPSTGIIDIGYSEVQENGKPLLVRKGVSYVDRVLAQQGSVKWEPISFSGIRYLAIAFRGFSGDVVIRKVGMRSTEPAVEWSGYFQSCDERLDAVWQMCQRSLRVGSQEGLMDCPTREQSPYVGDGHPIARWFAQVSGDARHWKYLVREQFRRQSPGGLVRPSVFSGCSDTLIDYTLLAVIGTRDYLRWTGDLQTAQEVLPACRKAVDWFTSRFDARGLFVSNWTPTRNQRGWENRYDPTWPVFASPDDGNLFIDHPGMGWHNVGEAGIDRRGLNAAINLFIVMGLRALADLDAATGGAAAARSLRQQADTLAAQIKPLFFDPHRQAFVDGIFEGRQLTQISEQTNTLAIAAGCCDAATSKSILTRILTSRDANIARNGPYFWCYLMPVLIDLGLEPLGLDAMRRLWGHMLDHGATTLWETFSGDDKDSWCHPWSGAPVEFCITGILGLPGLGIPSPLALRPRYDLLERAAGAANTCAGLVSIRWQRQGETVQLSGHLPAGLQATLLSPSGIVLGSVQGDWSQQVDLLQNAIASAI